MSADHDPLCLAVTKGGFWPNSDDPATAGCWVCDLIARVRADERQKARQRVEAYADDTHPAHGKRETCPRCDITAVLRYVAVNVIGGDAA